MKIYTKAGDNGTTSLVGGERTDKDDIRLEAYGTIDELNSNIGMIRNFNLEKIDDGNLNTIQNKLFTIGSLLATSNEKSQEDLAKKIRGISQDDIINIELWIDNINETLIPLKNFVIPTGNKINSWCNISRTVCRRAERRIVSLSKQSKINCSISIYINRLSDYLFVLGRKYMAINKTEELLCNFNA